MAQISFLICEMRLDGRIVEEDGEGIGEIEFHRAERISPAGGLYKQQTSRLQGISPIDVHQFGGPAVAQGAESSCTSEIRIPGYARNQLMLCDRRGYVPEGMDHNVRDLAGKGWRSLKGLAHDHPPSRLLDAGTNPIQFEGRQAHQEIVTAQITRQPTPAFEVGLQLVAYEIWALPEEAPQFGIDRSAGLEPTQGRSHILQGKAGREQPSKIGASVGHVPVLIHRPRIDEAATNVVGIHDKGLAQGQVDPCKVFCVTRASGRLNGLAQLDEPIEFPRQSHASPRFDGLNQLVSLAKNAARSDPGRSIITRPIKPHQHGLPVTISWRVAMIGAGPSVQEMSNVNGDLSHRIGYRPLDADTGTDQQTAHQRQPLPRHQSFHTIQEKTKRATPK